MDVQALVIRKTIPIVFSRSFESLLLNGTGNHLSLTHDLEAAVTKGLEILEELEDVHDIKHVEAIRSLVNKVNAYAQIDSPHFSQWHINVAEDLLDEVDLLILTHGEDLLSLGIKNLEQGTLLVLLATATHTNFTL